MNLPRALRSASENYDKTWYNYLVRNQAHFYSLKNLKPDAKISVSEKKLMDTPGSEIEARCLCFLT